MNADTNAAILRAAEALERIAAALENPPDIMLMRDEVEVTTRDIRAVRKATGCSHHDALEALRAAYGDREEAVNIINRKGQA